MGKNANEAADEVCGLVLAGGQSRRMGTDKALLLLDGHPVIQWVVEQVAALCDEVILVVNEPARYEFLGLPIVTDQTPYGGPLVGLYSGLRSTSAPWCLAVACDMPLVRTELLQGLLESRGPADAVLPRIDGRIQPFPGLYSRSCIDAIGALLTAGRSAARDLAEVCRVTFVEEEALRKLDPDLSSFRDMDTPSDFEEMKATGSVRGPL